MRTVYDWGKAYLVWDLEVFRHSDLRTCATHRSQRIGVPFVSGRCELPADGNIVFPLKAHYDAVNIDIFNPLLDETDPFDVEEKKEESLRARAPQDLDARVPLSGTDTPLADPPQEPEPIGEREDCPPREAAQPDPPVPPPERTKGPPTPRYSSEHIDDEVWLDCFQRWTKNVSSEFESRSR